ncbi:hypothetical protein [Methanobrevibacter sp.]|uniref:hypothetical protein n=1 Tax=Methanobrevibacter sp. TaxID=66852 RepID=UPI00386B1B8C
MVNNNINGNKTNSKNMEDDNMVANTDFYIVTEELKERGWMYDDTGVYVPYTHKNKEYHDNRIVFLKISRKLRGNKLKYTFVKLEEGLFYPMSSYTSPKLINENDEYLIRKLANKGIGCGLNSREGIYIEFVSSFKEKIKNADCLDVLKLKDIDFPKQENLIDLTIPYEEDKHHNFTDMNNLMLNIMGQTLIRFKTPYNHYLCPFCTNDIAKVSRHVLRCVEDKNQYDQTEVLMKFFNLETPQEAEEKFQELMK